MMRRVRAVAVWVAVLLAVSSPAAGVAPPATTPAGVSATAARLDALVISITGNVQELRAAEILNYHRIEGGMAACMRAAGHRYRKQPYVSFYRDFTDADLGYGTGGATIFDSITAGPRRSCSTRSPVPACVAPVSWWNPRRHPPMSRHTTGARPGTGTAGTTTPIRPRARIS